LHRCLQRHGISRLPEVAGDKPAKQPFKRYPIGYFHIDIAEVRTEEGKLYLFVAVDRTTKYAFVRLVKKATGAAARTFLDDLVALHSDFDGLGRAFRLARAGVSNQRGPRCCEAFLVAL
jgi:transposase-like protein